MKYRKAITLTTHVDRHGDRFTREALTDMVDQIDKHYVPVNIEHDPRIPPQGRVCGAEVKQLDDGEYALETLMEVFESGDTVQFDPTGKRMITRSYATEDLHIIHDRSYASSELQNLLREIGKMTSARVEREEKKALELLSVLTIGGLFIAGGLASGFLAKVGSDCWDVFKAKLKDLLKKKRAEGREHLLIIQCATPSRNGQVLFDVVLTNPSDADIEGFFTDGTRAVDTSVLVLLPFAEEKDIVRVVFDFSDKVLSLRFAVRSDAVPMTIRAEPREEKRHD